MKIKIKIKDNYYDMDVSEARMLYNELCEIFGPKVTKQDLCPPIPITQPIPVWYPTQQPYHVSPFYCTTSPET